MGWECSWGGYYVTNAAVHTGHLVLLAYRDIGGCDGLGM